MLLFQRAVVEGSYSLLMKCSQYENMTRVVLPPEKNRYRLLLELLTPVAKTYASEMGIQSTSPSIQCFGGYGYCQDFPVEQHFRDMRIHPIHEGTTGIQGIDLLGRKVVMENGKALVMFLEEVQSAMKTARKFSGLLFLADAALYLEFFGIITIAWQWLLQSISVQKALSGKLSASEADFYQGKFFTARYFFAYELPRINGLAQRLTDVNPLTVEMNSCFFSE